MDLIKIFEDYFLLARGKGYLTRNLHTPIMEIDRYSPGSASLPTHNFVWLNFSCGSHKNVFQAKNEHHKIGLKFMNSNLLFFF